MHDPSFDLEQKKYENPIPSRELILSIIKEKKLSHRQLYKILKLTSKQSKPLKNRLRAMVRDKELSCSKNGVYRLFSNRGLYTGVVIANPKGFGFIKLDNADGGKDLRLSSKQMQLCFHGDRVKARVLNNKLDAEIVKVISKKQNLVARLKIQDNQVIAIIDDKNIKHEVLIENPDKNYKEDDIVVLDIVKNPSFDSLAIGKIVKKLGDFGAVDLEVKSAIIRYDISDIFDKKVEQELAKIPNKVLAKDKKKRKDLTNLCFVTIDGKDSRDFDDAVFCTPKNNGYELIVAIADVSHYVKPQSSLDKEALNRGNSVYFPKIVVPMLPEKLSNNLCSLNEKVIRLALACKMQINHQGEIENFKFFDAIIKSRKRLTYNKVNSFLSGKKNIKNQEVAINLNNLYNVYKLLKIDRAKSGVIELGRLESNIIFDDKGKILNIKPYKRGKSHKIIEECMLAANRTAGKFLTKENAIFLYRTHPKPTEDKLLSTRKFLSGLGLQLDGGNDIEIKDLAKLLSKIKDRDDENIIKTVVLRTMSQASYSAYNNQHFGLSCENYTHFTSPIRRYADLLTHRAIKAIIHQEKYHVENIDKIAEHISVTERVADEASRDCEKWLKCEYMKDKVGDEFIGTISRVTSFGFFVEIDDIFIEGLVSITSLNDYFIYDELSFSLIGKSSKKVYKLGEKVKVLLSSVNLEGREINLVVSN